MESNGMTRRTVLAGAGVGLAAAAAPAAAATTRRLGEPSDGTAAAEVFGQIAQEGDSLTGYGYLTRLSGLADSRLFSGAHTEAGARLTFSASAAVRARYMHGAIVSVTGTGTIGFHLDAGGDFANPPSFADGPLIASFRARFQNVAAVTAPNQAVTTLTGELLQTRAATFTLGGRRYQLGHKGLRLRMTVTGQGSRTNPSPPRAVFDVAGAIL
jgi:hypothetical protein